jgi:NTP-dependent ternary system trypsin peptidase co-occuring protein
MADSDNESPPAGDFVSLADAAAALREQLLKAISAPAAEGPRFTIDEIEMEFSVEAIAGADGRVTFGVVGTGTDGRADGPAGHRVRIRLRPTDDEGGPVRISRGWDEGDQPR